MNLHNWDVNYSLSELPQFSNLRNPSFLPLGQRIEHVALALLSARFESAGTWRHVTIRWVCELVFVLYLKNFDCFRRRQHLPSLHLMNLYVFLDDLDSWNLPLYHHGCLVCP